MTDRKNKILGFLILNLIAASAWAAPDNVSTTDTSYSTTDTDKRGSFILSVAGIASSKLKSDSRDRTVGVGGGALIEAQVNPWLGLETGALLLTRTYEVNQNSAQLIEESTRIQVPILARFWPARFFSVGAGPFMAFKLGKTSRGSFTPSNLSTSAGKTTELGAEAAATFNMAVYKKTGAFLEGRLSRTFGRADNESNTDVVGLLGIKLDLGA